MIGLLRKDLYIVMRKIGMCYISLYLSWDCRPFVNYV